MNEYREKLTKYLGRFIPGRAPRGDEDLFVSGFITSLSAMQLVGFVEREFGLTVENDDLVLDNFRTIDNLSGMIQRKLSPANP